MKEDKKLEEFLKLPEFPKEFAGKDCVFCGHPMPDSEGMHRLKSFITKNYISKKELREWVEKNVEGIKQQTDKKDDPNHYFARGRNA